MKVASIWWRVHPRGTALDIEEQRKQKRDKKGGPPESKVTRVLRAAGRTVLHPWNSLWALAKSDVSSLGDPDSGDTGPTGIGPLDDAISIGAAIDKFLTAIVTQLLPAIIRIIVAIAFLVEAAVEFVADSILFAVANAWWLIWVVIALGVAIGGAVFFTAMERGLTEALLVIARLRALWNDIFR
jgi:hypothetical protein